MKRWIAVLLLASLIVVALTVGVSAETTSGTCGDNLTWKFADKVLTISGTGPMYDYKTGEAPWMKLQWHHQIVIEPGVTSIGSYAFAHFGGHIDIPESVTSVGEKAFAHSTIYLFFKGGPPEIAEDAFSYAHGSCMYIDGWEEKDMQAYGGRQSWERAKLTLENGTKLVYSLNEQIKPEDLVCAANTTGTTYRNSRPYVVEEIKTEPYDNSVPGEKKVKITVQGREMIHTYLVTDGISHLDDVKVTRPKPMSYRARALEPKPTVTAGSLTLAEGVHYILSYANNIEVGPKATVTVTGIGEWEGLFKKVPFEIVKYDISKQWCSVTPYGVYFSGVPVMPSIRVAVEDSTLKAGRDYIVYCENNINLGTAQYRVVGIGNYCGSKTGVFTIYKNTSIEFLSGAYIGQADGELDLEQYHYSEIIFPPGIFEARIDHSEDHIASYELYKVVGEEMQLIDSRTYSNVTNSAQTTYEYDFSDVYEGAMDVGGEIYMLSYSWVDVNYGVYTGICAIIVPAKVPDATQMAVEAVEEAGDFRYAYLTAYGLDGNVGDETWTSSNPAVATVEDGVVTMKKPGTVTFTAQYGELSASISLMILPEDLTRGEIVDYDAENGKVSVFYDGYLLEEGTDYTQSVLNRGGITEVIVQGKNLFEGQLVQEFNEDGQPVDHSHRFDNDCDPTCNGCDYTRITEHVYSDQWSKSKTHHWHRCTGCGEIADRAEHIISEETPDSCTICGLLNIPGDLNGDVILNEDDAIYLLRHVLMPEQFPVTQQTDYDGSGTVDEDDAIYLLRHVLMPEQFPL